MRNRSFHPWILICLLIASGCGNSTTSSPAPNAAKREKTESPPKARVSDRPGNVRGGVLIVEYHKIAKEEARWDRSIVRFQKDLERLYRMGFRPVSLSDYLDGKMDLAPGASPVVFTFDDSQISQFRMLSDGRIDPDCAVGIWRAFAEKHPDFPVKATFFVLPPVPFGQKDELPKKLAYLKEWGCELGSHTASHKILAKLSDAEVKEEFGKAVEFISGLGFPAPVIALPFGISPKNAGLLMSFEYQGKRYGHRAALLVGANPAPPPGGDNLNPMRLPRIQSIEGDYGLTFWLDKIEKGETRVYVQP